MSSAAPAMFSWVMTPEQMVGQWNKFLSRAAALPRVATVAQRVRVGATPNSPVFQEDGVRLLRYEAAGPIRHRTPLLLVFALVNRPYILDLKPGKSVIAHFVNAGFDVYNVDWGVPTDADRHLGLEDYVLRYLHNMVSHVRRTSGAESVNLLGYCMGGSMSAMYTALRPEPVRNLMLLTAPLDWSHKDNLLSLWCDERYFDVDRMLETHGNAPAAWLQSSFQMLKPVQNLMEKYVNFWENVDNERFLEDFFAMETWLNDNIPVAGQVFRQFVKLMFQQNRLIEGRLEIGGERVDLSRIRQPLLNLIAQNDHLVPPNQSLSVGNVVSSTDKKTVTFPAGHIGMAVGGKAHKELWPMAVDWLAQRSEKA